MKSVMTHQFSQVPQVGVQRSTFDRSCGVKTTLDSGYLVPIFLDEVLPGDSFNLHMTAFARMNTPLVPVMDNLFFETFFFFCPSRLLWDNWIKFQGEQRSPTDSTDFVMPTVSGSAQTSGGLWDYFGLPTGVTGPLVVNALPFRMYNLVFQEWFKDENLVNAPPLNRGDGPDLLTDYTLRRRMKRHDYFTSALPFAQKGPDVLIPISGTLDVLRDAANTNATNAYLAGTTSVPSPGALLIGAPELQDDTNANVVIDPNGTLYVDLTSGVGVNINELRQSVQLQRLFERDARSGTRYYEALKARFSVSDPGHAILQRPEYLGGGTSMINIHPVAQTSGTAPGGTGYSDTPQGNLAAFGTMSASGHGFTKSFTEHGYIMGLCSIRADLTYQQGVNRMWSRSTRFDFYEPVMQALGEQPLLNKEIYAQSTAADDQVFGYVPRWDEYRYKPSLITGKFRSNDPASLDVWHLAQDFAALPTLNATFIEENPPVARVIATPTEPEFKLDAVFNLRCARPMPVFGVPGMIDHF